MNIKYPGAFSPLNWPLDQFVLEDRFRGHLFRFPDHIRKTRYPIASLRYWWLGNAIRKELQARSDELKVVDAGCHAGVLRGYVHPMKGTRWTGLDHNLDWPQGDLDKYDALICCDFESELPLEDSWADVIVCSHVLEHLPKPQILVGEIVRVLKKKGIALIIVPILPKPLALIAEWNYAREFRAGTRKKGSHTHAFWPSRVINLAQPHGLDVEIACGTYFLRIDGCRLENLPSWIRANQYLAGMFPSLGGEFCMQLRKPGGR